MNETLSNPTRFDTLPRIAYVNALFIIGTLGTLITPAMFETWMPFHWTPTQLGLLAAIELAALALGSLSGLYWQRRWNWRRVAFCALLMSIIANMVSALWHGFPTTCVARGVVGLSGGLLCVLYSAILANAKSPGRIIAVTTFIQIGVEAAIMFSTTEVAQGLGSSGLFILMALLFVALVPFLTVLPLGWPAGPSDLASDAVRQEGSARAYPLLLSFVPFIVVQTGVFTFLGEFGRMAAHLSGEETLHAIGISVMFSSLGSVGAYVLDTRIGLRLPIGGSIILMIAMLFAMVWGSGSALLFLVYISLLQIGWIFLNCYLYSALIDANNLLVPAATPLSTFGSAMGASAMGYVLEHNGLPGTLELSVGALVVTALLTLPFLRAAAPSLPLVDEIDCSGRPGPLG